MRHSVQVAAFAAIFPIAALATSSPCGLADLCIGRSRSIASSDLRSSQLRQLRLWRPGQQRAFRLLPIPFVYNGEVVNGDNFTATGVPGASGH